MKSDLESEMISFSGLSGKLYGYLTRQVEGEQESSPAIIVIHAIFGLNDHIKNVADRFASRGYVALAPNLYSAPDLKEILTQEKVISAWNFMSTFPVEKRRDTTFHQQELAKIDDVEKRKALQETMGMMFGGLPKERMTKDLLGAVEYLASKKFVKADRIGSVGFCFGGGMSINLGCEGRTAATVIFYGENPSPIDRVRNIVGPVLGIYGGEDTRMNEGIDKLVKAMIGYKKDFEMRLYPGAPHEFFNDTNKAAYREESAREAWERVVRFYERILG
ncbi:MAG: dienelactone hydrolase family protein [Nitrososphaerales archaeon]